MTDISLTFREFMKQFDIGGGSIIYESRTDVAATRDGVVYVAAKPDPKKRISIRHAGTRHTRGTIIIPMRGFGLHSTKKDLLPKGPRESEDNEEKPGPFP